MSGGDADAAACAPEIVKVFESKRKNKTAALEHLVKTAQRIEREWDLGARPASTGPCASPLLYAASVPPEPVRAMRKACMSRRLT